MFQKKEPQTTRSSQRWSNVALKCPKMAENSQKQSKAAQSKEKHEKISQEAKNSQKWTITGQDQKMADGGHKRPKKRRTKVVKSGKKGGMRDKRGKKLLKF